MKNLKLMISLLVCFVGFSFAIPTDIVAQENVKTVVLSQGIPVPDVGAVLSISQDVQTSDTGVVLNTDVGILEGIFATFLALVAFIPVAVQFLRNVLFKNASGLVIQVISWVTGLVITLLGWWLNAGFLAELSMWQALIYGAGSCLAANGIFDTGIVSAIIDGIFKLFKSK